MKGALIGVGFMTMLIGASGIDQGGLANIIVVAVGLAMMAVGNSLFNAN